VTKKSRYALVALSAVLIIGLGVSLVGYLVLRSSRSGVPVGVPDEVRYVPANAALVAYANVRGVMNSELRKALLPAAGTGPRQGRHMMNDFAGIDVEKQVDHVLAYVESTESSPQRAADAQNAPGTPGAPESAEVAAAPTPPRGMMFVRGSFEQGRVEQSIRDHGGIIEDYHGHHISVKREGSDEMAIGFVRPDLIAIGQADLVRRALVAQDSSKNLTSNTELMDFIRTASGSTAWVVGHFDAVSRGMKLPTAVTRQVPPIRLFSAKADVNGGLKATIAAETDDEATAQQLRDVVRGFLALGRLQGGSNPEFESALKSIQLSGTNKTVQLSFSVSPETMRSLAPERRRMSPESAPPTVK
jgi:hypothetical protein